MDEEIELTKKEEKIKTKRRALIISSIGILVWAIAFAIQRDVLISLLIGIGFIIVVNAYFYFRKSLKEKARIRKIESVFPDFLQLVSSNLRAGMTVDRSILAASRKEFSPLDEEILRTGRDITTGKSVEEAMKDMGKRIKSEKISKIISIVITGMVAGGNLAVLLDETSRNMREREFVEKKAASSVLMYEIFIFLAVSIFAPALYSLSTVLVGTLNTIVGKVSIEELPSNLPITFTKIDISLKVIISFAILFMITIDFLASLVIGLVSKGEEDEGIKFFPFMVLLSLGVFFGMRIVISNLLKVLT